MTFLKPANDDYGQSAQYSIYVYHNNREKKAGSTWEMKGITPDMDEAISHARLFFDTSQFGKVEVKKRVYDNVAEQAQDTTIKVFEKKTGWIASFCVASAALMAALILVTGITISSG